RYRSLIDQDVVAAVSEFFSSSKFPSGCNASFITLIPKTHDAKLVKDFRPISLIGSIYKIITNIMANLIILVMSNLVSDVQSAFVANRQILNGPFILNELILWCKYKNTKVMIFKVDFEKAFDSVRWDYLDDILDKFDFDLKWRGWIQGYHNSAKGSILVNGSPTSEFIFHKGLKQGDPLSPFLFILVMESLHISFKNVLDAGLFKGIQIDDSMTLSHLFYADDAVFIGQWDKSNISTLVNVLNCFFLASGLKINLHKSKLMGIGVKVGGIPSRSNFWEDVIDKISPRLSKWKLKTLSIGGRLTLIKSVLSSMPLYQMSMYKVPMCILNRMESIRRDIFNGVENKERKLSMISWKKVLAAKNKEGLGISSLFAQNRALLFKWIWHFLTNDASLWSRFSKAIFGINLLSHAKIKVGNGINTSVWNDVWLSESPLKQCFPRLFALEDDKLVSVFDKLNDPSLIESFRRTPRGGIEDSQLHSLAENVAGVILSSQNDRWVWSLESSGLFSVKSARVCIDDFFLPYVGDSLRMGDEHLDTILEKESDEFIKSSVENLIPSPSESKDLSDGECDVPACDDFTTFSNLLFDADHNFSSSDDKFFDYFFFKIDSLLDEFAGELILLKSISPGIDEAECDPEEEICLIEKLLYDNSSPRPSEEFISENSNAAIESFSPSPIPVEDSDSLRDEIDLSLTSDDSMPPGIDDDDFDSEGDILIFEELLSNDSLSLPEK
nr:RNA-directed DNA polymerase, eukaryota [Tanacetum cinerariifolium]